MMTAVVVDVINYVEPVVPNDGTIFILQLKKEDFKDKMNFDNLKRLC
jgi:hypothetical protein